VLEFEGVAGLIDDPAFSVFTIVQVSYWVKHFPRFDNSALWQASVIILMTKFYKSFIICHPSNPGSVKNRAILLFLLIATPILAFSARTSAIHSERNSHTYLDRGQNHGEYFFLLNAPASHHSESQTFLGRDNHKAIHSAAKNSFNGIHCIAIDWTTFTNLILGSEDHFISSISVLRCLKSTISPQAP
jgi:hypothetical protein